MSYRPKKKLTKRQLKALIRANDPLRGTSGKNFRDHVNKMEKEVTKRPRVRFGFDIRYRPRPAEFDETVVASDS